MRAHDRLHITLQAFSHIRLLQPEHCLPPAPRPAPRHRLFRVSLRSYTPCAGVEALTMRMKLNVFRKGLILISVPLLLHLGFFGVLADMQSSNRQAVAWSLHSKEVLEQTQVVLRTLLETGTSLRGYILSGDNELGAAYRRGAEQLPQDIVDLKRSVADNPGQVAQVHAIASATEKFLSWHAETVRQAAAGQREQAVARARSPEGDTLMRAIQ